MTDTICEDLDRRIFALPRDVQPTKIQLTTGDLTRLRHEANLRTANWQAADAPSPETYRGIPIEIIEHGGPHIHYSSGAASRHAPEGPPSPAPSAPA
jgi:hypothetical protein